MNGKQLNEILNLNAKHALYRKDGSWYHHLKDFPGILFDLNGFLLFNSKSEYVNHPRLQHAQDLHIKDGISSIKGYRRFSYNERREIILCCNEGTNEESIRKMRDIEREEVVRNISNVRIIKSKYKNKCQICYTRLKIGQSLYYSEVHHIKPLGNPHKGPDKIENMICVCPNCHILLDLGAKKLTLDSFKILRHNIKNEHITYYSKNIFRRI